MDKYRVYIFKEESDSFVVEAEDDEVAWAIAESRLPFGWEISDLIWEEEAVESN